MALQECPNCDSGKFPYILTDNMGCSCGYVCEDCVEEKKKKYNPAIFKQDNTEARQNAMECGESIEPDDDMEFQFRNPEHFKM